MATKAAGVKNTTKDQLLDATSALMLERNSTQLSFGDISKKSGINGALIRYHFGTKLGLLEALLERDAGGTFAALEQLVTAPMDAVEKLRHHIHGVIKVYHRYPYMNRLVGALTAESGPEAAQFISERFIRPLAAAQKAILDQGVREGSFRAVDPMLFYFSVIGACDHLFHARSALAYAFDTHEIDDDLRRAYADHICNNLLESIRAK